MKSRNQRLKLYTSVLAIVFTAVSTAQLSSMVALNGDITNNVYAKYSNNQAQSFVNECGLDGVTGINCANNGPLMQGDGLASSPVITQFGGGQRGTEPTPPPTGFTVTGTGGAPALLLCGGITAGTNGELEFSAEEGTDGTVTGTYNTNLDGDGTITDGTTDGSTFSLSGLGNNLCNTDTDVEITISGDCGDDVTITYEDPLSVLTVTGDVECILT